MAERNRNTHIFVIGHTGVIEFTVANIDLKIGAIGHFNPVHTEQINGQNTFLFELPASDIRVNDIREGDIAGFKDGDGILQFFEIKRIIEDHSNVLIKKIFCEHEIFELLDEQIVWKRFDDATLQDILDGILDPSGDINTTSRWKRGTVVNLGTINQITFRLTNKLTALLEALEAFKDLNGGAVPELDFRYEFTPDGISNRFIDILAQRGQDRGKRFEYRKDITKIEREIDATGVKTAMYGFGATIETPEGQEQRLRFKDVEWTTGGGDPADKPIGQEYVEDPTANTTFGRFVEPGSLVRKNRFGIFDNQDIFDEAELLQATWDFLQTLNTPIIWYRIAAIDLEEIAGLDFEKVRLGDTATVIDTDFSPSLVVKVRVIEIRRNLAEPEKNVFIFGNFIPLSVDEGSIVRTNQNDIKNNRGSWEGGSFEHNMVQDPSFEQVPQTGAGIGVVNSFDVDLNHPAFDEVDQSDWWQWVNASPFIFSTITSDEENVLFDTKAAIIQRNPISRPFQFVPLTIPSGRDGPYFATAYVTAYEGTTADVIATMELWAVDNTFARIGGTPINTFNVPIRTGQNYIWKRFGGLISVEDFPVNTEFIEITFFNAAGSADTTKYLVDGAQIVNKTRPAKFLPESSFFRKLSSNRGLAQTDAVNYKSIRLTSGKGTNGAATIFIETDTDNTVGTANPTIILRQKNNTTQADIKMTSADDLEIGSDVGIDFRVDQQNAVLTDGRIMVGRPDGTFTLIPAIINNINRRIEIDGSGIGGGGPEETIRPNADLFGFVGTSTNRWFRMHAGAFLTTSEKKMKQDIEDADIEKSYERIKGLKLKRFRFKKEAKYNKNAKKYIGIIADDQKDEELTDEGKKNVSLNAMIFNLVGANQKLISEYEKLERRVIELENLIKNV